MDAQTNDLMQGAVPLVFIGGDPTKPAIPVANQDGTDISGGGGGSTDGLTDDELRAAPVPVEQSEITKSNEAVKNAVTLTAGAGNDTSSAVDMTAAYGGTAHVKITNGATAPTVPAQVQMQVSGDNSKYYNFGGLLIGSTVNAAVSSWAIDIPAGVMYVKFVAGSNTAQNVTLDIDVSKVTKL